MRIRTILAGVILLVAAASPTHAQTRPPEATVTPFVESDGVRAGSPVRVALTVGLPEGLHVQSDKPRDPSPELMARFAGHKPRVEPVSHARVSFDEGVRHRDTGEQGIIFRITSLKRFSENVMEAEGGYYVGNLSASGNVFRVERIAGVWVVTGDKMEWIA